MSNDWISLMVNLENPKFWKIKEKIIFLFFLYIDIFFYFSQQARIDLRKTDGFIAWSTINSNLDSSRVFLQQVWIWQWLYFVTTDKSALKPLNHSFERILFFSLLSKKLAIRTWTVTRHLSLSGDPQPRADRFRFQFLSRQCTQIPVSKETSGSHN